MDSEERPQHAAPSAYWRSNTRLIAVLTAVWVLVAFVLPLLPPGADFSLFGAPFPLWVAAQGGPIVFVLLVWVYERCMDRLDRRHGTESDDD